MMFAYMQYKLKQHLYFQLKQRSGFSVFASVQRTNK